MKHMNKATVSCINFSGEWGNKAARLEKMKTLARQAARQGADIIVFPELALSGYECDEEGTRLMKPCRMHDDTAETVPGPSTEEMATVAKEFGVYIIFGMPERDKADRKIRYNSAAIIAPEGIMGSYRKLNLAGLPRLRETICFAPGAEIPVWETRFGLIGVLVCYDFNFVPELARIMALKGARLIVNTMGAPSAPGKGYFLVQQTGCRATENFVFTATANLAGLDRVSHFCGNSTIAGPSSSRFAGILATGDEIDEIISTTLNFDVLDFWNEWFPWKTERQVQARLIAEEFTKLASAKTTND